MKKSQKIFILLGVFFAFHFAAQADGISRKWAKADTLYVKKKLEAIRADQKIKIDGSLDDNAWANAEFANTFYTYRPTLGELASQQSQVKVVYDDHAIYIGALLLDDPDSVLTTLSKRDDHNVNADKFWITLNPYNDGKNIFRFEVTAANVQSDIKLSARSHDRAWNAVWYSEVAFNEDGWIVEMKIPYDAIRFPTDKEQEWTINFWREVRRTREISSWNFVDRTLQDQGTQDGRLTNIKNIKAPLRLALYPYVSGYVNTQSDEVDYSYSAGMDLKYGINESFTLDMILIPDFGQRKSDNTVLNLSPFEVKYDENRPFFTEGTELFNKAGLFYSRRVGQRPSGYYDVYDLVEDEEEVIENPDEANLINATKISGRTKKGTGLGFFNAITTNTYAKVNYGDTLKERVLTEPFTNYNMLVYDKNIGKYSYVNLTNTNVFSPETGRLADVIGSAFKISDKNNLFAIQGKLANSIVRESSNDDAIIGQHYDLEAGKVSGNFRYDYRFRLLTDDYDHNDMGYLRRNNETSHRADLRYVIYEPFWILNNMNTRFSMEYQSLYQPKEFTEFDLQLSSSVTFKNYYSFGFWTEYSPVEEYDYYEPRVEGRYLVKPESYYMNFWMSTDYRKRVALDLRGGFTKSFDRGEFFRIGPRFRLNHKLSLNYNFEYDIRHGEIGYVTQLSESEDSVIMGKREKQTITNRISGAYVFNNKMSLSLNMRHYWSAVNYYDYYQLEEDGSLGRNPGYDENEDFHFNVVNVDMVFSWNFAPGSFLNVVWKNSLQELNEIESVAEQSFVDNLENTLNSNAFVNSFSVKLSYYLDYKQFFKGAS